MNTNKKRQINVHVEGRALPTVVYGWKAAREEVARHEAAGRAAHYAPVAL